MEKRIIFIGGLFGGLLLASIWGWAVSESLEAGLNKVFYEEYRWESFGIGVLGGGLTSFGMAKIRQGFKSIKKDESLLR